MTARAVSSDSADITIPRGDHDANRFGSPNLGFVYVAPHTFHMRDPMDQVLGHVGDRLRVVHVADTFDHRRSNGLRYITNPPESPARVHQHLKIGDGDVDWDTFFAQLNTNGFYDRAESVMVTSVFGENENAAEVSRYQLEQMRSRVGKARDAARHRDTARN